MKVVIERKTKIKLAITLFLFIDFVILGKFLLGEDLSALLSWWLALLALTATFYPLASILFKRFFDGGWIFSKAIGIAFSGWLLWYLSSMKILKFTRVSCFIIVFICLILNFLLWFFYLRKQNNPVSFEKISSAVVSELLFFVFFLIWTYLRGFKPEAYGTEKFMDYAFMTSMMRTDYMPPTDMWLSGNSINYYYLGQYFATYLTKLSGVIVGKGYNLMLMTLASLGFVMPYSIIANVTKNYIKDKYDQSKKIPSSMNKLPVIAGSLAGVAVSLCGNMQFPIYKWFLPRVRQFFGIEDALKEVGYTFKNYWFPDATRYIGYFPETNDKTIHEFPVYSFVLGDLHAHVINIIFVLTVIALLYAWLLRIKEIKVLEFKNEVFNPTILALGFFIGIFHMTNYWDFPIYFVVSGAVILFMNARKYRFKLKTLTLTFAQAIVILIISTFVALPFTISFDNIAAGIRFVEHNTPIYQLIILWGLPIISVVVYLFNRIFKQKNAGVFKETDLNKNRLYQFIDRLNIHDLFILVLGLCAIGLVLIPEVIYVKDIYTGDHKRANTMFKLTYQSFIMFGMAMSYILVKLLIFEKKRKYRIFSACMLVLLITTSFYFVESTTAWFGNYLKKENYKTLDASAFMERESMDDYIITNWMNENIEGMPVTLEVNGDSYTYHERVSVITGLPTVLGWKTHEWLWRSDETAAYPKICEERAADIKTIYTSDDLSKVKALIEEYNIEYIYVGKLEANAYDVPVNHDLIRSLGQIMIEVPENDDKDYSTYLVKVAR